MEKSWDMQRTCIWVLREGVQPEALGFIPQFLTHADPRPAREQFDTGYVHGGGWTPFNGFTQNKDGSLSYPGDPPMVVLAECKFRDEVVRFHECSWVSITQPDGSFEVCRMD